MLKAYWNVVCTMSIPQPICLHETISRTNFHRVSNAMENSLYSHPNCRVVIAMKFCPLSPNNPYALCLLFIGSATLNKMYLILSFCTWYDSDAVVAYAKLRKDGMPYKGISLKPNFHPIWIMMVNYWWNGHLYPISVKQTIEYPVKRGALTLMVCLPHIASFMEMWNVLYGYPQTLVDVLNSWHCDKNRYGKPVSFLYKYF